MKKYISIILTISLVLVSVFTINVSAGAEIGKIEPSNKVMSVKARDVSDNVLNVLSQKGARIKEDSLIEVLKVSDGSDTAICVTNFAGEEMEQDVFMAYKEDEEGNLIVDNSMAEALAAGYDHNMSGSSPPISWDGRYIVNATATAKRYVDGIWDYYKPYKCSFNYTKYENVTVNSIEVRYITSGVKHTYPGYEYMDEEYDHMVSVYKANPVEGTTYTNYNYFPEDFVLACDGTEDMVLTFINKVNGSTDSYTVKLTNKY